MIFEGTFYGIACGLILVMYLACTIWWQKRFGGFVRHIVLQAALLGLAVYVTVFYSRNLSNSALQDLLDDGKYHAATVDTVRFVAMYRYNGELLLDCGVIFAVATLILGVSAMKFHKLEREQLEKSRNAAMRE